MLDVDRHARALTTLAETSPNGVAIVDGRGLVEYANPAMGALLGMSAEEVAGQPIHRFLPPADPFEAFPPPAPSERRRRLVRADGSRLVVTVVATPVPDGEAPAHVLLVQEERREPEAAEAVQARAVQEAASALAGAVTVADVTRAMERQVSAFEASGLLISLADGPRLRLVSHRGYSADMLAALSDQPMSQRSPMVDAVHRKAPLFVETLQDYVDAFPERRVLAHRSGKQAWAFLPMLAGGEVIGSWCLSFDVPHRFTVAERALLTTLSGLLAHAVARSEMLEAERSVTRTLQRSLLPATLPDVEGCEIAVRYSTAVAGLEVGGDFYDVVPLPGGGTGIVIGDAQGHSAAAAALMGQVRAALRAYAAEGHDPGTIVARANRFLVTGGIDSFVTCTFAALDATQDGMTIVRAGHTEPILVAPDGAAAWLEVPGGLPLGIEPKASYPVTWIPLAAGCRVVFYTDGLVEQRAAGLDAGERALLARIRAAAGLCLQPFADAVLGRDVAREDDVAVLVLERVPRDASAEKRQAVFSAVSTDRSQVRDVRRMVTARCTQWGWDHRAEEVELLVSELVTNAMVHVGGRITVTLTASARELTVSVADTSVQSPAPGSSDVWDTSGRGLGIVDAAADAWGVDPSGPGKSVWFAMRSPCAAS